jgi:hypothetical protein
VANLLTRLADGLRSRFAIDWNNTDGSVAGGGIDAIDQTGKRRNPSGNLKTLDDEIPDRKRRKLTLTSRSVARNFEIAAWAIRKHLDFVSTFSFRMGTGIEAFDRDVESFVKWWMRPNNFDASGRHGLSKSIRMAEACRTLDGDMGYVKLRDGRSQAIEGDRILTPDSRRGETKFDPERTFNGVECSSTGRSLRYALHSRKRGGGFQFERWVPRKNFIQHAHFDRFDQVRGLSPITASLNRFQDVYEGFDYALARTKVAQLFGLVLTRDADETGIGEQSSVDSDGDDVADTPGDTHSAKLGTKPWLLDMNPGENAHFLENKTPAPEFQQFENMMIGVAIKSLDLPFSFYDESFTNFFGSKAALTLYLQSVRTKRLDVEALLVSLTIWRLKLAIEDGEILLPSSIKTFDDVVFKWSPAGIPWFDPRDVVGDINAIKAGLKSRTQVRMERFGDDWRDTAKELAEEEILIEDLGLNVTMEPSLQAPAVKLPADEKDEDTDDEDDEAETDGETE